jgi:endonuclease-3
LPVKKRAKPVTTRGIERIIKELRKRYPPQSKTWNKDPFHVLIGTIISQRTRDEQTAEATRALFSRFDTPEALAGARVSEISKLIRPAGFYNVKARMVKEVARIIHRQFNNRVPEDLDTLLGLPSVGRKTANCVLVYGFNKEAIPVDTHVHRISNRLGWVRTRTPDETEMELVKILPRKHWIEINDLFVTHGRDLCRPAAPRCSECPVRMRCDFGKVYKQS